MIGSAQSFAALLLTGTRSMLVAAVRVEVRRCNGVLGVLSVRERAVHPITIVEGANRETRAEATRQTVHVVSSPMTRPAPFEKADIEQTLASRFTAIARLMPNRVALTGCGSQWTYRELERRANGIAHAIDERVGAG